MKNGIKSVANTGPGVFRIEERSGKVRLIDLNSSAGDTLMRRLASATGLSLIESVTELEGRDYVHDPETGEVIESVIEPVKTAEQFEEEDQSGSLIYADHILRFDQTDQARLLHIQIHLAARQNILLARLIDKMDTQIQTQNQTAEFVQLIWQLKNEDWRK